jgi:hypothetical protein
MFLAARSFHFALQHRIVLTGRWWNEKKHDRSVYFLPSFLP